MATVRPTRTLNPLPFGDLEPKRFEDLIRQLAYEFRRWRKLEATGRAGGDDGFDARGYEIVDGDHTVDTSDDTDEEDVRDRVDTSSDRLWLIQCKRENSIGPTKLGKYLDSIKLPAEQQLYGIVFAAACDFSKKSRDVLAKWCRENQVSEWIVWGRGELEDQLFQPKSDGLLFAYFGISLAISQRSAATEIRRQIANKRKLKRFLNSQGNRLVLIRDINEKSYPYVPEDGTRPRFRIRHILGLEAQGVAVKLSMRAAWLSPDNESWDAALGTQGTDLTYGADDWNQPTEVEESLNNDALETWNSLPASEKAWVYVEGILPYNNIVLIDDVGDESFDGPQIYVTEWSRGYPWYRAHVETIEHQNRRTKGIQSPDDESRIAKFPRHTRAYKWRSDSY